MMALVTLREDGTSVTKAWPNRDFNAYPKGRSILMCLTTFGELPEGVSIVKKTIVNFKRAVQAMVWYRIHTTHYCPPLSTFSPRSVSS